MNPDRAPWRKVAVRCTLRHGIGVSIPWRNPIKTAQGKYSVSMAFSFSAPADSYFIRYCIILVIYVCHRCSNRVYDTLHGRMSHSTHWHALSSRASMMHTICCYSIHPSATSSHAPSILWDLVLVTPSRYTSKACRHALEVICRRMPVHARLVSIVCSPCAASACKPFDHYLAAGVHVWPSVGWHKDIRGANSLSG
jgi:hypothetical protein